jgi:hypothetical protein
MDKKKASLAARWGAVALAGLALAACQENAGDFERKMMTTFDSCAQGRYSEQDYVRMNEVLRTLTRQMDINGNGIISSEETVKGQSGYPEKAAYLAIDSLYEAKAKICFGADDQAEEVMYDFFNRSLLVRRDLPVEKAAQSLLQYMTSRSPNFWTLNGPGAPKPQAQP